MTDIPDDWILIEAAKRCGWGYVIATLQWAYRNETAFRALCDMIAKHEQPPVDRKLLCAREACREAFYGTESHIATAMVRAIELYLEGYGE